MKDYTWKAANSRFIVMAVTLLALGSSDSAWGQENTEDKIKSGIDTTADALKKAVEKIGDKLEDIQDYFHKKFHEQTSVGPATVTDVKFNDHSLAAIVKPGERIEGQLKCTLDKDKIKDIKYHRLILGFKGEGAQTSIGSGVGYFADKESKEKFVLIAPSKPGFYQVRFRPVESYTEHEALKQWKDDKGQEPDKKNTIGLIYVKA